LPSTGHSTVRPLLPEQRLDCAPRTRALQARLIALA